VQAPEPHPALKALDFLVGEWELEGREDESGGRITGRPRFEWMDGRFYLAQHVSEPEEGALTIWGGDVDSPASFEGEVSPDGNTTTGRSKWPGGGYQATMSRIGSGA
jgi:hypothetical protein